MAQFKIAYPMRVDALQKPGGDLLQIQKYIECGATAKPGFIGDVIVDLDADLTRYDVVHLTNIDRPAELYRYFTRAREANKPVILSSIHHSYREVERFEREARRGFVGCISRFLSFSSLEVIRSLLRCWNYPQLTHPVLDLVRGGVRNVQSAVLASSNRILVLTEKECVDLAQDIRPPDPLKLTCLRNGFDPRSHTTQTLTPADRDLDVCVVGRIESRKNQIAILSALNALDLSGVFVGRENRNHARYCKEFKRLVKGSKSSYLGGLSHPETVALMRRAKVHVSASWFEVSSLVDIEAFFAGCRVVSSRNGGTCELLGKNAHYIDPGSPAELRAAITAALNSYRPPDPQGEYGESPVLETWDTVATRLLGIYEAVLRRDSSPGLTAA